VALIPQKSKSRQLAIESYTARLNTGQVTKDDLRGERDVILDLYKHHLKLLLEANVFIYAVTGALLSFVFTHLSVPHIRWVLSFPFVFGLSFVAFFWMAGRGIEYNQKELDLIAGALPSTFFHAWMR
jgi:hypothetical protein